MKQGNAIARVVMILLAVGVAVYLGVYVWRGLTDPFTTVMTYPYSMDDAAPANGLLVRSEVVIPGQEGIVDLLPAEGEKVGVGQTVAMLYRDSTALDRKQERLALQLELEQLNYALRRRDSVGDTSQLDADIVGQIAVLRGNVSADNLTGLEDATLALRSMVLKRVDAYGGTAESVAAIEALIADTTERLRALDAASALDSTSVPAGQSGIFSALVDGYEAVIRPDMLPDLTAAELTALLNTRQQEDASALGKLIVETRWYFAARLDGTSAARLEIGKQARVCFSRDFVGEVSMRVEHISENAGGYCAVVFSSTQYLSDTTLLRRQTVDILFQRFEGIRIPKEALRIRDGVQGVYTVVGAQAEFNAVEILREGETFFLVSPVGEGRRILRAGDEVIVTAEDLYNGKVVR